MAFVDNTTGGRVVSGQRPVKITLSGTVKVGDLVGYASGWKAADMNSSPKVYPELIAGEAGVSNDVITAFREAAIDFGTGCTATAGDKVYASTDAGQYIGAASNDQAFCVGVMATAQVAFLNPQNAIPAWKVGNYSMTASSGHVIQLQLKPNLATTGTASVTCIELAPKVLDAVAAGTVTGVGVTVDLEGASAGTVTTARCYLADMGSDSGTVRTVTNAHGIEFVNNFHGTVTNGPYCMKVNTHGGNVAWAGFALLPDDGAIATDTGTPGAVTGATGWIKVVVGSAVRYIALASSVT